MVTKNKLISCKFEPLHTMLASRPDTAKALRTKGYRATPQRIAICDALWEAGSHPTVAEVHEHVSRRDPTISLATVYKTLQLFAEIGLATEMGFRDESTRYDPETGPHIHMICRNCGRVEDYGWENLDDIVRTVEERTGFKTLGKRFELYGTCRKCKE